MKFLLIGENLYKASVQTIVKANAEKYIYAGGPNMTSNTPIPKKKRHDKHKTMTHTLKPSFNTEVVNNVEHETTPQMTHTLKPSLNIGVGNPGEIARNLIKLKERAGGKFGLIVEHLLTATFLNSKHVLYPQNDNQTNIDIIIKMNDGIDRNLKYLLNGYEIIQPDSSKTGNFTPCEIKFTHTKANKRGMSIKWSNVNICNIIKPWCLIVEKYDDYSLYNQYIYRFHLLDSTQVKYLIDSGTPLENGCAEITIRDPQRYKFRYTSQTDNDHDGVIRTLSYFMKNAEKIYNGESLDNLSRQIFSLQKNSKSFIEKIFNLSTKELQFWTIKL